MSTDEVLRLHVLDASGRLESGLGALTANASAAFYKAAGLLELGQKPVDVVMRDAPVVTVPELGIGGATPDP